MTPENFWRYVEFENLDQLRAEIAPSNRCIFAVFHYGNFEWLSPAVAWGGMPTDVVTQEFKNPLLDKFFSDLRDQSGHKADGLPPRRPGSRPPQPPPVGRAQAGHQQPRPGMRMPGPRMHASSVPSVSFARFICSLHLLARRVLRLAHEAPADRQSRIGSA